MFSPKGAGFQKLHVFGKVRLQASAISRGPSNIVIEGQEGEYFYGWPVLSLEARAYRGDRVESRSVYANLSNESQQSIVLRAVCWNGRAVRNAIGQQKGEPKIDLVTPAKYVKLPVEHLRKWLSEFDDVSVAANDACGHYDEQTLIRGLRIDKEYMICVFEKVWQAQDSSNPLLDKKWDHVWQKMTEVLAVEPSITDFDENFWIVNPEVKYDFGAYQANWFTLE
jgi:hypothetical protein